MRDITRYIISLLIFLGLLGTFYGLATTVPAVVDTIRSLAPDDNQTGIEVFANLMSGLEAQLGGMGTAFSSSLLGLAGSLVVGLLELFAGHGQNRFLPPVGRMDVLHHPAGLCRGGMSIRGRNWARLSKCSIPWPNRWKPCAASSFRPIPERAQLDQALGLLVEAIDRLAGSSLGTADPALERIATAQEQILGYYQSDDGQGGPHSDAEIRLRLRNIDGQLLRISEELSAGRLETTADLRSDLSTLTLAVRQLSRSGFGAARKDGA